MTPDGTVSKWHKDDADWTIDICLKMDSKATGSILFKTDETDDNQVSKIIEINHKQGEMLSFASNTLHCVTPLSFGQRVNLVLFLNK